MSITGPFHEEGYTHTEKVHVKTQQEGALCKAGCKTAREIKPANILNFDSQHLELWESKWLLFEPPCLGIVLWKPLELKTIHRVTLSVTLPINSMMSELLWSKTRQKYQRKTIDQYLSLIKIKKSSKIKKTKSTIILKGLYSRTKWDFFKEFKGGWTCENQSMQNTVLVGQRENTIVKLSRQQDSIWQNTTSFH